MSKRAEAKKKGAKLAAGDPKKKVSAARKAPSHRRTRMIALEPRMLFDGALGLDLGAKATAALAHGDSPAPETAGDATVAPAAPEQPQGAAAKAEAEKNQKPGSEVLDGGRPSAERREIVFVDAGVDGYEQLLSDVDPNARVVLLDPARDGIAQIIDQLSRESSVDAIHIVSHGSAGALQLGTATLDAESMRGEYALQLAQIGRHLSQDADILVYGCDFGQGEAGQDAAMRLAYLTGADVAASDDRTGHAELGGDWDLEVAFGQIESDTAFGERAQKAFRHVLATLDWDAVDWTAGATSGTYAVGGNDVSISLTGSTNKLVAGYPDDTTAMVDGNTGEQSLTPYVNAFTSAAEFIDITIDFAQPGGVSNVSFSLFDVDANPPTGFIDRITITATDGSGTVNPTSISRAGGVAAGQETWTVSGGNTLTGNTGIANTGAGAERGTAVVTFNQTGITQIVLRYENANPGAQQAIGIHDIGFDAAPVNTVPGAQTVEAGATLPISGLSVTDAEGNLSTTTLAVGSGTLNVSLAGGASISGGANDSSTLTLSGTEAQINAALASLAYSGNSGFAGADTLTVTSTDSSGQADTDAVAITVTPDTVLDLNSTPSVSTTVATATSDLVTNGDMNPITGWTDTGPGGTNNGRWVWTNDNGTLTQAITVPADGSVTTYSSTATTLTEAIATTSNAITSIAFDYAWSNTDTGGGANDNRLEVRYDGVLYARFTTGGGGGATGSWTYFNGASGTAGSGIASVGNEATGTLSSNVITLGTPVSASGDLVFSYVPGPSGSGGDDLAVDNVVVTNTATTTTTTTTVDLTDTGWTATFTENGAPVAIADSDSSIFDGNSADMTGASVTITNAQAGDELLVNGSAAASGTLASGISWTRTPTTVTFSGTFGKADYADAIEAVQFGNTTENPSTTARSISVTVTDGSGSSNAAIATVDVVAVNDAPVAGDAAVSVNEDQALNGTLPVAIQPGQGTGASGLAGRGAGAPAVGGSPAPASGTPATGFGSLPLGLPVDIHVPPSSLVPADPAAADFIDLNALPPTSAGPATAVGFPLVRLPEAEAGFVRLVQSAPETVFGGHRLFVFHGIPNLHLAGDNTSLRVPEDAFAHTDPAALVHLEARLADGRPLPGWLKFDGLRGIFSGEPPRDVRGALEIEVIARDDQGREARTRFILLVEDLQAQGPVRSAEVPDIMLGLDVDAKEAEKQRLEAEKERLEAAARAAAAKPAEKSKPSAQGTGREVPVSFSEQMKAARAARDPLLDRIARTVQQRPDKP